MSTALVQHIRQAAAHEDAAGRHVEKYEAQMKSAGASMFAAFQLAVQGAEDFKGRKLNDKAMARLYQSTAPRPWWDKALVAGGVVNTSKVADRERAKRLIQWHMDPDAAKARDSKRQVAAVSRMRNLRARRTAAAAAQGRTFTPKSTPTTAAMRAVHKAGQDAAHAGRELPSSAVASGSAPAGCTLEDMLGEFNRISAAIRKVKPEDRTAVFEILRVTAREVEGYTS